MTMHDHPNFNVHESQLIWLVRERSTMMLLRYDNKYVFGVRYLSQYFYVFIDCTAERLWEKQYTACILLN